MAPNSGHGRDDRPVADLLRDKDSREQAWEKVYQDVVPTLNVALARSFGIDATDPRVASAVQSMCGHAFRQLMTRPGTMIQTVETWDQFANWGCRVAWYRLRVRLQPKRASLSLEQVDPKDLAVDVESSVRDVVAAVSEHFRNNLNDKMIWDSWCAGTSVAEVARRIGTSAYRVKTRLAVILVAAQRIIDDLP